ncbi:MAG: bifunctional riboflavin kinase/FAD synthetase [Lachnospiraceae bacterium]
MEIITGTTDFYLQEETAVAIGKFDGVHIGHRRLLEEILGEKSKGRKACVFTFDPPPAVFFGKKDEKELTTKEEKRKIFEFLGIDILIEFPMNAETAAMLPQVFVTEVLCNRMNAACVAAGTDLSFGAKGAGNAALLKTMAVECEMEVRIIDKITLDGQEISSTLVRKAIEGGDMVYAEKLLGTPFMVSGIVQHGNHIGRTLGMPTVNLIPPENKLLPPCGVYYSGVLMDGVYYKGISNIGYKPTVKENRKVLGVETYLYGFDANAYGEEIEVNLYEFKRPEQNFGSMEALKKQMQEDISAGAAYSR